MLTTLLAGLGLGLSLIVAIGAQNLFVLRQGVRREHVLAVVAVCALSDAVLIVLGVSGVGLVLHAVPWLIDVVRWAGALFLAGYGLLAARRAWRPAAQALEVRVAEADDALEPGAPERFSGDSAARAAGSPESRGTDPRADRLLRRNAQATTHSSTGTSLTATVATALALTWLNPHVYLDTVFLLGSVASTHGDARWVFALGAVVASFAWFAGLGFGARFAGRLLATPRSWRVLDGIIAVVMIGLAVSLVLPH